MTLEDFFTLTEMSNGLTAPARVQDLVSIMQKEVCVVKNAGEITRQWSAVASAIAATENKECLELFIQLDGLCFVDSWLKDAQNFVDETSDNVEELITRLLVAVERLHVDFEKSVSSGIRVTVKSLLDHESSKVQQRARALFDNWEREKNNDAVSVGCEIPQTIVDGGTRVIENVVRENEQSEPSPENVSLSGGGSGEKCEENVSNNIMPSSRSDVGNSSGVDDTKTSDQNLEHSTVKDGHPLSPLLKPVGEDQKVESSTYHAETISAIDTCSSASLSHGALDRQTGVPVLESVNCSNHTQEGRSSEKLDSASSKPLEEKTSSSGTDAGDTSDAGNGSDLQRQTDIKDEVSCRGKSPSDDASVVISEGKTLMDDSSRPTNHSRSSMVLGAKDRKYNIDRLHNSSSEHSLECPKDLGAILSKVDLINGDDKQVTDESEDDSESDSEFGEPRTVSKDSGVFGKKCDIEFDYGIIDPLEVARQVAIEVEREVQSCSSEKIQESKIHEPDSADSMSAKECQKVESSKKQVLRGMALLTEASITNSEAGPKNEKVKVESSQGTDLDANAEKGQCDFDLNLEVCSDDIDHVVSTCISVVSASKATAAPGMPVAPLEFEGALGWKGSASTSAFRPASSRRVPESAKAVFSGGSRNDSSKKQQQGWLDIDLNVAEGGNDKSAELFTVKLPLPSALPSGESSVEASSRKSERVELDLNCASEEGEAPSDWRMEGRILSDRNGHWSPSPSSSSSSKHLSSRNFDLNDQPSFLNNSSDLSYFKKPSQNISASGGIKSANSVVSIMGMKVEVKREDVPQFFPFPNGRTAENTVDLTVARSGGVLGMGSPFLYTPSPTFGYNSIVPGPPIPFSSAMYGPGGPIPYMVDSRGAPMVPQFAGSASAIPPSFAQQPFIISMAGAPVSNGVLPPQSGLDLNTSLIFEGGNRDLGGLRQFFTQGQARSMDEHLRTSSQPSTSSLAGEKRKEPDGGWEPYPFKLHPPSWK
ncbi:uncharacterized protein [Nicotiana sylvestris]|uniref:Uncharacterized protein LOC104238752 n=1 Tax=Nicotiana sylvestris TaxID=4096 RepID=A0A1U7XHJ4_NICSY|nr:PREDICTED: uncharacterized protein LOC104238752 [Nicotiana sylvestris]